MAKQFTVTDIQALDRDCRALLTKYDYYFIKDLSDIKNKNNTAIVYIESEDMYCIITGRDLKKTIIRKMRKNKSFQVT